MSKFIQTPSIVNRAATRRNVATPIPNSDFSLRGHKVAPVATWAPNTILAIFCANGRSPKCFPSLGPAPFGFPVIVSLLTSNKSLYSSPMGGSSLFSWGTFVFLFFHFNFEKISFYFVRTATGRIVAVEIVIMKRSNRRRRPQW